MMLKLFHCFTAVAASWLFVLPVCAQRNETVTIPTSDGRSISAGLYLPAGSEPKPGVMVLFTFFGWENGRAEVYDHRFGEMLAEEGFVALVPNFVDRSVVKNVYAPTILQDLQAIAGWLAVRPEVADKLVGAVGFSYGGTYASFLAAVESRLKAIVTYYGVYNLRRFRLTAKGIGQKIDSPVDLAERINAAVLIVHGEKDNEVLLDQATEFLGVLKKSNKVVDLVTYPNAYHRFDRGRVEGARSDVSRDGYIYRFDLNARDDAWNRTVAWLKAHLR